MREDFIFNSKLLVRANSRIQSLCVQILSKMEVLYSLKTNLHMHRVEQHPPYDTRVMDEQSLPYLLGLPTEKHPTWSQIFYQQE